MPIYVGNKITQSAPGFPLGYKLPMDITGSPEDAFNYTTKDQVATKIKVLLNTPVGTRPCSTFGLNLKRFLFEPDMSLAGEQIKEEIRRGISRYIPEVDLVSVSTTTDPDRNIIHIRLQLALNNEDVFTVEEPVVIS